MASNISQIKTIMKNMVAMTAEWQTLTGAGAAGSKAFIFTKHIPDASFEANPTKTYMLISMPSFDSPEGTSGSALSIPSGTLRLRFFFPFSSSALDSQDTNVLDWAGTVAEELIALSQGSTGTYLMLRGWSVDEESILPHKTERADHQRMRIDVMMEYGLEQG